MRVAVADALETGLPRASFDLLHERLLLTNVTNAEAVVTEMVALTCPGGVVALQDVDVTAWFCEPSLRARLITFVDILREAIVDSRVLTEGELDALRAQLQAHLDDPGTIVFGGIHFQAWGRKP